MKRTALLLGGIGAGIGFVFAACSLDLDESLIAGSDAGSDVSTGGASGSGGAAGSGGSGGTGGKIVDSGPACDADPQCTIDGGCIDAFGLAIADRPAEAVAESPKHHRLFPRSRRG